MSKPKSPDRLPLAKALLAWCDPTLIDELKQAERRYIPHQLNEFYRLTGGIRFRVLPDAQVRSPGPETGMGGGASYEWLIAAWNAVEVDFRQRLVTEIYLMGVQVVPQPETVARPIPQAWASDAKLDMLRSAVEFAGQRYAAITASKELPAEAAITLAAGRSGQDVSAPLTVDSVRHLSDDEILLLLEEHARRVINSPDAKLIAPGKISLMPIVRRKMIARADEGDILASKRAECEYLARWIAERVQHFQTPTKGTIGKVLGAEYEIQKARSTAAIQ